MPVYEYQCKPNGHRFEVRHGMNEASPLACPECGAEIRRVILPVGIVFKGAGFYATDSRSSAKSAAPAKPADATGTATASSNSDSGTGTGGDSNKTEGSSSPKAESSTGNVEAKT